MKSLILVVSLAVLILTSSWDRYVCIYVPHNESFQPPPYQLRCRGATWQGCLSVICHFFQTCSAWLIGRVESVSLQLGGIMSPICPGISSSCLYEMEIFAAPLDTQSWSHRAFYSFVFCLLSTQICHYCILFFVFVFYCISNNLYFYNRKAELQYVFVFLFTWDCFMFWPTLCILCLVHGSSLCESVNICVFLPLWSLISTAAWASNSREISSLLPLRAAWCSGDSLHTGTDYV